MRRNDKLAIFKILPPKLAIGLVVLAIAYAFVQPYANSHWNMQWPSIASMLEGDFSVPEATAEKPTDKSKNSTQKQTETADRASEVTIDIYKKSDRDDVTIDSDEPVSSAVYEILKPLGNERYVSPAGIIYGRGGEEGHRLAHIKKHLTDQPNRPGSHGVFEGSMAEFLADIDDAYTRAMRKSKGTSKKQDEGMTIIEANFDKPIGFVGGSEGKRDGNPASKRLRIVISGKNLITAFPI